MSSYTHYQYVLVKDLGDYVYSVQLNRPKQLNAVNFAEFRELAEIFTRLDEDSSCRVILLSGAGRAFSSGIDLQDASGIGLDEGLDEARKGRTTRRNLIKLQDAITTMEKCCKPVIAVMHGYALGVAIDIASACDIRFCTKDVRFSVKEVAIGLAADVGSLNRLPKIVGNHSWLRDLAYSAREFNGPEALQYGLVSRIFDTQEEMMEEATKFAKHIASNSPVAVQGTKVVLNYARDHPVDDSLQYVANWNMSQLHTDDIAAAVTATMSKGKKPVFSKL